MAALCHDIGHLPFSHAAEDVLPDGIDHELLTRDLIRSDEMKAIWKSERPTLEVEDIVKSGYLLRSTCDIKCHGAGLI